ncbi:MAG: VWA domain-containing protein [Alistipes sp.]|nr:VWA domain-containing protein [Candidatus Alistipes equi]
MEFANKYVLWALLVLPLLVAYYIWRLKQGGGAIRFSSVTSLKNAPKTLRYYLRHLPFICRICALALIIVALARPRDVEHNTNTTTEGIDIVLAIDISGSMLARDFHPDRLSVAKEVAAAFISDRVGDRIGIVVFAGEAFTQSPLTTDQSTLQTLLSRVRSGIIEDGTAIGNGLATAVNRLRESDTKSKVVILLTDGVNNRGQIAPLTASQIAKDMGIKVYTIGVGKNGEAPYPVADEQGNIVDYVKAKVEIDEKILSSIASQTGGRYFRATNEKSLKAIYDEINQLEKSKVEVTQSIVFYEKFAIFALLAIVVMMLEFIVSKIILKRIP